MTNRTPKVRLNLSVPSRVRDSIVAVQERTGADTICEAVRRAVSLYAYLLELEAGGGKVMVAGPDQPAETLRLNPS